MDANLELARTKLTIRHVAQHAELADAESLLNALRETVTFLERRITREKIAATKSTPVVASDIDAIKDLLEFRDGDGPQVAWHKGRWWHATDK